RARSLRTRRNAAGGRGLLGHSTRGREQVRRLAGDGEEQPVGHRIPHRRRGSGLRRQRCEDGGRRREGNRPGQQQMTAHRTDLVNGGAIAVISAGYYIATFSIEETANIVTPRTFPAIVGIALIVLGLFLAGRAVYRARKASLAEAGPGNHINGTGAGNGAAASAGDSAVSDETAGGPSLEAPPEPAARKVVFQFALFFVYLAILIPVGFLLSTVAFL